MDFLQFESDQRFQKIVDEVYNRQLEEDPQLDRILNKTAKKKMYQDVRYNLNLLFVSLELEDETIFEHYARWIYQLLCPLMTYCSREEVRDQMTAHYRLLEKALAAVTDDGRRQKIHRLLARASEVTAEECRYGCAGPIAPQRYQNEIREFLGCLLKADTRKGLFLLSEYLGRGIPLSDVYVDIAGEAMCEIGDMWHRHQITVDQEHYCTSTTQLALSQLYPVIFRQERKNKTMLSACVGSELHEMGARMVADLFEYNGWDSIYLGAAVPAEALLSAVELHDPGLVALSVTMPQHLIICRDTVEKLREKYPKLRIAVGGKAFENTNEIWRNWRVDVYTRDARELVKWAEDVLR